MAPGQSIMRRCRRSWFDWSVASCDMDRFPSLSGRTSMAVRVGINGFGRIGRNVLRACLGETGLEFVAVNDITDAETLAHLLKYDSVHGTLAASVSAGDGALTVNGNRITVTAE